MNRYLISTVLAIAAAGITTNALADDITIDTNPFTSTATRAQVQAELKQFQAAGVNPWAQDYNQLADFHGSKTRAQVQAEYIASRDRVAAFTSEDSGSAYLAGTPVRDAAPVVAGQPVSAQ
jgi:hypothetical protein